MARALRAAAWGPVLAGWALAACSSPEEGSPKEELEAVPPAGGESPQVFYLRQEPPAAGIPLFRVNLSAVDAGSLSTRPPRMAEDRSCGSVVAFGMDPEELEEAGPVGPVHVREVLYRIWWYAGTGRGTFALNAPGLPGAFGELAVAAGDAEPGRAVADQGYLRTTARIPVDQELDAGQVAGLYLTLDVAGASVKVATCPHQASLVVLNPRPAGSGRDADGDGVSDREEWERGRDPYRGEEDLRSCLPDLEVLRPPPPAPLPDVPEPEETWSAERVTGERHWFGRRLLHTGDLEVQGTLALDGTTLVLGADPETGEAPEIRVQPGGTLVLTGGSLLVPQRPALGFHMAVVEGARLRVEGAAFHYGGAIQLGEAGRVLPQVAALAVRSEGVLVKDATFRNCLLALDLEGDQARVLESRFEGNGTAIRISGRGARVAGNTSLRDGLFLLLDRHAQGARIIDNEARWSLDMALRVAGREPGTAPHEIAGNRFRDVNLGIQAGPAARGDRIRGNTVTACRYGLVMESTETARDLRHANTLALSDSAACAEGAGRAAPFVETGTVVRHKGGGG